MAACLKSVTDFVGLTEKYVPENRTVFVGNKPPPVEDEAYIPQDFPDNTVVSSKYTALNFFPKNLFEQFRRIANFYFLCVAVLQLAIDTPVSPWTSILPLIFVVGVSMIKQGYEDWLRHKADNEVNKRATLVVRDGVIEKIKSKDVRVGDIVKVQNNDEIPCDMVCISSVREDGDCHVTTANLDGETNLKIFRSLPDTAILQTEESLNSLTAVVECQQPILDLYKFVGRMTLYQNTDVPNQSTPTRKPLTAENVLLRGCRLKNTEYVYGCAVYTGEETKMGLNSKTKGQKFSCIETVMNYYLLFMLGVLIFEVSICTGLKYFYNSRGYVPFSWYFYEVAKPDYEISFLGVMEDFLSFLVLYNYIIPISLYVTIEMQKFLGSMFIGYDIEMYDEKTNERAVANTSDLNEELGQVEYMFTDKTGTLTENEMKFRQCSINGVKYVEVKGQLQPQKEGEAEDEFDKEQFLLTMALCHTVHVHKEAGSSNGVENGTVGETPMLQYEASSPDEKALVEAASQYGTTFLGGTQEYLEVKHKGQTLRYQILNILEFDPTRKCMSIILKSPTGENLLLCKGAESSLLRKSVSGKKGETDQHVSDYAMEGLRTLCFGQRKLSDDTYAGMEEKLRLAATALDDREEKLSEAYDMIEQELHLLGATGVEDRLQDQVAETMEALREAGIKIWVLTGDKQETAVNISHSCGHFKDGVVELLLVKQDVETSCVQTLRRLKEQMKLEPQKRYALVVDGPSLALTMKLYQIEFRDLCLDCEAVLCCRMSPFQKAQVVKLVKESPSKPSTMAIGDGANDVSMIQEAHLGLGIMGKEGRQAVRCSDYAFSRFKFLLRILLVHGQWYYHRIGITVQYFFYKNFAFITAQFYFAFFSEMSQQPMFDSMYLTLFNITFCALPILLFGIFEQNLPAEMLLKNPKLYKENQRNSYFKMWKNCYWVLLGIYQSIVFFFGAMLLLKDDVPLMSNMKNYGLWSFGTLVTTGCVLVVNFKLCIEICNWDGFQIGGMIIQLLGYPVQVALFSGLIWHDIFPISLFASTGLYWVFFEAHNSWTVWFWILGVIVACFLPDYIFKTYCYYYYPSRAVVVRRNDDDACMSCIRWHRRHSSRLENSSDADMTHSNANLVASGMFGDTEL
ncbi:probable phospholipid-transporting ATPase IF isoform X3 [Strongylocentrotus purpuratus]|uniref:Phospholipid-transporting ATPase n=1 Tax=Strongylocentrotus purpuratus TaxID=7668 RepID=A0A7M7NLW1_STRPU|nr:probable phospholipid-transporting ATPase IF isoform X3 [Strongylocentrotus purpuratus]